jgi:hypothetical protein
MAALRFFMSILMLGLSGANALDRHIQAEADVFWGLV